MNDSTLTVAEKLAWLRETQEWPGGGTDRDLRKAIVSNLGRPNLAGHGDLGDLCGSTIVDGVRFTILPQGHGPGRMQAHCPACATQVHLGLYWSLKHHLDKCIKEEASAYAGVRQALDQVKERVGRRG